MVHFRGDLLKTFFFYIFYFFLFFCKNNFYMETEGFFFSSFSFSFADTSC